MKLRTAQYTSKYQCVVEPVLVQICFSEVPEPTLQYGRAPNSGDVCTYCPMSVMSLMSVLFFVSIMALITENHGVHVGLDECDAPGVHDDLQ